MTDTQLRPAAPGDEHALALVGAASFLETFAGVLDGADILAHCEKQHATGLYAQGLARDDMRLWIAQTATGASTA